MIRGFRLRITFQLTDAAAEWAGSALTDLFPDGLLLQALPGGVTRLQGWLLEGKSRSAGFALKRLASLGATRARLRPWRAAVPSTAPYGRFPVLRVGRFIVAPAGGHPPRLKPARAFPIVLTQGQAFGSGRHESTRLMLAAISALGLRDAEVLDVGAGSGILGFACLHLGARRVTSVEMESAACVELRRNRILNSVPPPALPVFAGRFPLERHRGRRFFLVLANLVTPLLLDLMPDLTRAVAKKGVLLCGGIHTEKEARVVIGAGRHCGLDLDRRSSLRQWHVLRFVRL